jgi:hypothetical protein
MKENIHLLHTAIPISPSISILQSQTIERGANADRRSIRLEGNSAKIMLFAEIII